MINLREKDKERLLAIFSGTNEPFEVWAYGSRVNGTAHPGSDLDLVVKTSDGSQFPQELLRHLRNLIEDSNIPIIVELRDFAVLPEYFRKSILSGYEVFYSNIGVEN